MTTENEESPSGELLLVAIVEMAPGQAAAGQEYEDAYLVDPERLGHRERLGDAAPTTRVIEVLDLRSANRPA